MAGVNKVILIGNLGKDPEMKYGQTSNKPVCRFSLAVNERRGGGEEQTEWFNIVCFDRTAEIANEYLAKGRQVYIEGRLQTRKYQDQNGQDRYMTEVIANNLTMLGSRRDSGDEYAPAAPAAKPPRPAAKAPQPAARDLDPFSGDFGPPPTEDDMPF